MNVVTGLLHRREMSIGKLARLSKVGRTQLNLMLSGQRSGKNTWKHVDPFLHPVERDVLRRTTSYSEWERKSASERNPAFDIGSVDLITTEANGSEGSDVGSEQGNEFLEVAS
jgi:hypothetical protein